MDPQYVFGVFEGGGAKGIAYSGAISACQAANIQFEGACGASAGAIAAALVSAGLPAGEISRLLEFGMKEILRTGQRGRISRLYRAGIRVVCMRGIHSTSGVRDWLDAVLRQALNVDREVKFGDMPRPLAVLAYDRGAKRAKVWDTFENKGDSVAFAVSASCSIPIYFEPTAGNGTTYFDGGVVENAPFFVLPRISRYTALPAMAFRLANSDKKLLSRYVSGPVTKLMRPVGEMIDARSEITRPGGLDIREVRIDCGNVSSTDFDVSAKVRASLIEAGRSAVEAYVAGRAAAHMAVTPDAHKEEQIWAKSRAKHEALDLTGQLIDAARRSIFIFAGDTSWLESLAPYLLQAYRRGVQVRLITSAVDKGHLQLAARLGIEVGESAKPQRLRGSLIDPGTSAAKAIFVEKVSVSPSVFGSADFVRMHQHLVDYFDSVWGSAYIHAAAPPLLRRLELTEIERALRQVPHYNGPVRIAVEKLEPRSVRPSSRFVETFKLSRLLHVEALYEHTANEKGYHIKGTPWYSVWPSVEQRPDGTRVVIDGTHRFYSARMRKEAVWAFVVHGCTADLPSDPLDDWDHVRLTTAKLPREERFRNYNEPNFRPLKCVLARYFSASEGG